MSWSLQAGRKNRAAHKLILDSELSLTLRVCLPQPAFPCGPGSDPKSWPEHQMFLVRSEDGISWDLQGFTFTGPVKRCEGGQCMCGTWGGIMSPPPLGPILGVSALSIEHKAFVFL